MPELIVSPDDSPSQVDDEEKIPLGQLLLDMPFLLLTIGMTIMLLFYTIWGLYEVMSLPEY